MTKLHCKRCNELKTRNVKHIIDHNGISVPDYYPGSKNKKYIDDNGKLWSGKSCPDCHRLRVKEGMKNLRFKLLINEIDDGNNDG